MFRVSLSRIATGRWRNQIETATACITWNCSWSKLIGNNLSTNRAERESFVKGRESSGVGFKSLGVHREFVTKLCERGIVQATQIQQLALPVVSKQKNAIIHSETGSGKTLAFLLPALQDDSKQPLSTVIIVPTRELASQLLREAKLLSRDTTSVPAAVALVSGVDEHEQYKTLLSGTPGIVIGTPKRLMSVIDRHSDLFVNTKRIIIDEVDKVVSPLKQRAGWRKKQSRQWHPRPGTEVAQLIRRVSQAHKLHFVSATATISRGLVDELRQIGFEKLHIISSLDRNIVPSCISHQYSFSVENSEHGRINTLYNLFETSGCKSALVFVHRGSSVDQFVSDLQRLGIRAVALWRKAAHPDSADFQTFIEDFKSGEIEIVVANEETVRGLDFHWLTQAYLMDVPRTVDEYLHMCGRVGRQGLKGNATTVISNKHKDLVRQLRFYQRLGVTGEEIKWDCNSGVA
ncbi:DEAD-box ATP-dependent RNA helicase CshC-like [Corticium candelabrum]|uniref:DEAD-box ATP-dependent RNA helicase CshC-like n=1 Tax=Corticium candelabrum TaxID=121492 RepID=UPI002E260FAC|nr:DEAD-box ATP-dependent RNA helicase CshC-like [Corticium candelabrum]